MKIFEPAYIGTLKLENRLVRSATFEGMCDKDGFPGEKYIRYYSGLAQTGIGMIITGFCYCSIEGSAIQPGQCGIDNDDKVRAFRKVTDEVHKFDSKIIMQIAHTGRQTRSSVTGREVLGVSRKQSIYFKEKPVVLDRKKIIEIIEEFADSAVRAKKSGFDGVQIHAAHGYLVHQFILPSVNDRKDEFGINKKYGIGTRFLEMIISRIREKCGGRFPVIVKISGSDDYRRKFTDEQFVSLVKVLDNCGVNAIEISYGTMDYALNIFRGSTIPIETVLDVDPVYKRNAKLARVLWKMLAVPVLALKLKKFTPMYNMPFVNIAAKHTSIPLIAVGGFRSKREIELVLAEGSAGFISMCRPFIAEPDFAQKLRLNEEYKSKCINCNVCAVMTGAGVPTSCLRYSQKVNV